MKPIPFQTVERTLARNGFRLDRSSGSHFIWRNDSTGRVVVVPHHSKPIPVGTLLSIRRQAGIDFSA